MNNPPQHKRWYDRQPRLAQAVRVLLLFPDEIKETICEGMMLLANREFEVNEQINSVRTLGSEKIMGLYKSKNRRREYDQTELMHKAMNYLYILCEENQDVMADHILKLVQYIQQYLSTCQAFHDEPTVDHVAELTRAYVEKGTAEVEAFLNRVREEFYHKMLAAQEAAPPVDFLENVLLENVLKDDRLTMQNRHQD